MKKAYVSLPDSELYLSEYWVEIEYLDGGVWKSKISQYSYADVFEVIKDNHEDEYDRPVKSIKIELIR
jgi:hypothetical protein